MSWRTPAQLKDVLVEHIARDIKELQKLQSTVEPPSAALPGSSPPVYSLCDHLDHVLMHGLRDYRPGYWPFVRNFSHKDIIRSISDLTQVNTDVGRGRAWLFTALNEQVLGSYLRLFLENQRTVSDYYYKEAFLHDTERLLLLDTLVSGLDFVIFNLTLNEGYLDYAASRPSAQLGKPFELPTVEPSFISKLASHSETNPVPIPAATRVKAQEELSVSFAEGNKGRASGKEAWQTQSLGQPSGPERLPREPMPLPPMLPTISEIKSNAPKVERGEEEDDDDLVVRQRKSKTKRKKKKSKSKSQRDGDQGSPPEGNSQRGGDQGSPPEGKEQALDWKEAGSALSSKPSPDAGSPPTFQKATNPDLQKPPVKSSSPNLQQTSATTSLPQTTFPPPLQTTLLPPQTTLPSPPQTTLPPLQTTLLPPSASSTLQQRTSSSPKIPKLHDVGGMPKAQKPASTNPFDDDDDDTSTPDPSASSTSYSSSLPSVSASVNRPVQPISSGIRPEQPVGLGSKPVQAVGSSTRPEQPVGLGSKQVQAVGSKPVQTIDQSFSSKPVDQASSATKPVQPVDRSSVGTRPWTVALGIHCQGGGEDLHQSEFRKKSPHIFEYFGSEGAGNHSGRGSTTSSPVVTAEPVVKATASRGYDNLVITEADKHAADIRVDSNTKLVLSLDVLFTTEEEAHQERLVQVNTPYSVGLYRIAYVLVTNIAVYILRKDGTDGHYSREVGIQYKDFEHIVVGLDWQSLVLVYTSKLRTQEKYVLLTGSEAVSRSITESIQLAVKECPDYTGSVALNKEDEMRVEAIEKELIKLGSRTSMDIVKYSLVNWEQLKGDAPKIAMTSSSPKMGCLQYKTPSMIFSSVLPGHQWKTGYFKLRNTHLCSYNNEQDDVIRGDWELKGKSITRAAHVDNKPYAISIMAGGESVLVLAASSEEDYALWMSALCEAAIGQERDSRSSQHRTCVPCALLLTTNQIHVLQEDWSNETVKLVTSCEITDVCEISTDSGLPFYCTIKYVHSEITRQDTVQGVWLVCFCSEYELGKFVAAVTSIWETEMQIDLSLSNVEDSQIRDRAHKAVELMLSSKWRSDSVTRGRAEHI
eukprot:Em0008g1126a